MKNRKTFTILICFTILSLSIMGQTYSGGSGTKDDPFLISRNSDMQALAAAVNSGNSYLGQYFILTQDILDEVVTVIGTNFSNPFEGNFDGCGYKITVNIDERSDVAGVFGYLNRAVIHNLGVQGNISSSSHYSGGICGHASNNVTITNCYNIGNISFSSCAGGICGYATDNVTITNCYNIGNISSPHYTHTSGGICGILRASSYINSCFAANPSIIVETNIDNYSKKIGRIAGEVQNGIISNCYALASMQLDGTIINNQITDSQNGKDTDIASFSSKSWIENNLNWDFIYIWRILPGGSFPVFKTNTKLNFSLSSTNITYGEEVTLTLSSNHTTTPIQYLSSDNTIAEVVGKNINVKKIGIVTLFAYQSFTDIYTPDTAKVILTINKAPLIIKADNITSIYGDTPQFTCSYSGFVSNETENILSEQPIFTCLGNAQSNVGSYTVSVSGAEAENYTITYQSGELEILKRDLKVTPNDASRIYGDANPAFTFTYEGFVSGNTESNISSKPTIETTATRTSPVGVYEMSCSGGDATNYTFVEYGKANLEITKAPLSVTTRNVNRLYGSENPSFELLYSGFKNSETTAVLLDEPQITITATQLSSIGQYPIVISGGNAQNYSFIYNNRTLTINKAPLDIEADSFSMTYGDTPPQYTYRCIGFVNNETESVLTMKPILSCSGNIQSNVGNYPITVSGAEAENYSITFISGKLEVLKRDLKVTPNDASRVYGNVNPDFLLTYEGFVNENTESDISVKPTITTTATRTSPVGVYEISCSGGNATNYTFVEYGKANLEITKAPLAVTVQNTNRPYGSENPKFELSYSGFKNSETKSVLSEEPTITSVATKASSAGEYPLSVSGGNAQNYSFEYNNGTLNITQAPLFIIADNKTRNEGEPNPEFTLSYNGFKNNDTETNLDELPFIHCIADIHSPVGSYDIQLLGGSDNNYNYTLINGVLTIISKTGFKDTETENISLYPNPVQDYLFIQSELPIDKVEVYSLTGSLLLSENNFNQKINMQELPKGMCLIKIYTGKAAVVRQIINL